MPHTLTCEYMQTGQLPTSKRRRFCGLNDHWDRESMMSLALSGQTEVGSPLPVRASEKILHFTFSCGPRLFLIFRPTIHQEVFDIAKNRQLCYNFSAPANQANFASESSFIQGKSAEYE
jgi:hypothetical protein